MKKSNQKGFMLTETLIVSTLVIGVLLFLFIQFRGINQSYNTVINYNSADALLAAENLRTFYFNDNYDAIEEYYRNNHLKFLDLTNCPSSVINLQEYCNSITSKVNVKKVLFTDADLNYITQALNRKELQLEPTFEKYIRSLENDEEGTLLKYRIIVELNSGEFGNIKMVKNDVTPQEQEGLVVQIAVTSTPLNGSKYSLGEEAEYNIIVTNPSSKTISNILVEIPETGDEWGVGSLPSGQSYTLPTSWTVLEADVVEGGATIHVTATGTSESGEEVTASASKTILTYYDLSLDVQIDVTSTPQNGSKYTPGETVYYDVTVTNTSSFTVMDLVLEIEETGEQFPFSSLAPGGALTRHTSIGVGEEEALAGSITIHATATANTPIEEEITASETNTVPTGPSA